MTRSKSALERFRAAWRTLSGKPGGKWLFSRLFGRAVPYSGSVRPDIREFSAGRAVIAMSDRHAVRNHLESVHAVALVNLGEMATGLALASGMPSGSRSILLRLSCEFLKKARGPLVATCEAPAVGSSETRDYEVESFIRDAAGDVVAKATAVWKVGAAR